MTTIILHLPDAVPLSALKELAQSINCTLHHTLGHGYEMRPRTSYSETGMLATIASELCAAWAEGGIRAISYLAEAKRMAVLTSDFDAAEELHLLHLMLDPKSEIRRAA